MKYVRWALLIFLALVCSIAATIFLMGLREGADSMSNRVEINRPAAVVWTYLDDPVKAKSWVGSLKEIKQLTPGAKGVGTKEVWVMTDQNNAAQQIEIQSEITVDEAPKRLTVKLIERETFSGTTNYLLEDLGGNRTALTVSSTFHFNYGFARFLQPIIMRMATAKMAEDLDRLKAVAERE
ncbi:SRPBCC family protein [Bryobacter aggregatus]|uniref:SRPBCC family protein n=1 Tax=Bryobacter aggregatus TaxID=360054 RepID=UPI0004E16D38|nr:SRPBCC family protein [Bryobacter aggregatus]